MENKFGFERLKVSGIAGIRHPARYYRIKELFNDHMKRKPPSPGASPSQLRLIQFARKLDVHTETLGEWGDRGIGPKKIKFNSIVRYDYTEARIFGIESGLWPLEAGEVAPVRPLTPYHWQVETNRVAAKRPNTVTTTSTAT